MVHFVLPVLFPVTEVAPMTAVAPMTTHTTMIKPDCIKNVMNLEWFQERFFQVPFPKDVQYLHMQLYLYHYNTGTAHRFC